MLQSGDHTGRQASVLTTGEHTWPESLDVMGWRVEEDGLGVIFSRDIPTHVEQRLKGALEGFLARSDLSLNDISGIVAHPGGKKVLEGYERALGLPPETLEHARAVLKEQGNMSAVTVLSVLRRTLANGPVAGKHVMTALGPGFTAGFALLEIAS